MNRHSVSRCTRFVRPSLLLAVTAAAASAQAQNGDDTSARAIEEIVITADFRQAGINDIPASISVIDRDLMQRKNALHLEDVLLNAPNVNFASGASRARFYQIRGIGERGQFTEPLNPSVGLLIDGVDFSGIGGAALLYDMEQVEILMGPQGTRYGSNALAGLINLQSRTPAPQAEYGLQLQASNYDGRGIAGYISGPVTERLQYRVSVQSLESDGFGNNTFLDKPTNYRDEQMLRGKLRWQPTDDITLDLTTALVDIDNGYDAFSLDNTRDTRSGEPGRDTQDSRLTSIKLTLGTFEAFTLEAIAGLADADTLYHYDEDWTYAGFHPDEYQSTDHFDRTHDTRSGELRVLSTGAGALLGGRTSWVAGVYSLQQDVALTRRYTFLAQPFSSSFDINRVAAYADTTTQLGDGWSLDAGLRSERFEASYADSEGLDFDPADTLFGGKLALNYHTRADNLVYASVSRGYKTGGFNTDGSLDADLREFDKETLWNYELGFKGNLLDDRLQTRIALFWMEREDVQISSSTVRMREDGSSEFIAYTGNAAGGFNRGLEVGAQLVATDAVQLYGTLGLLDSAYEDFTNSEGQNLDGRDQAHAPRYQFTLGGTWDITSVLALDVNVQGRDGFYFSDSHAGQSDAHALVNASLTWTHDQWRATLWTRNLGDEDYYVRGYYFGNDPRDGYAAKVYTQMGEPRRYGLTMTFDF